MNKTCDCEHCKYADISKEERTVRIGDCVITQDPGGIICRNYGNMNITLIDDEGIQCSGFEEGAYVQKS